MFKKSLLNIFISLCVLGSISAQNAPVYFVTKTANFGKVVEEVGKIRYDFVFFNRGDVPIKIQKVVPSCGCTAAEYTEVAIPEDSAGHVQVVYNTINRPGEINKTVSVFFEGYETPVILFLKGIVVVNQRLIERELVYPFGNLRFQSKYLNLKTVRNLQPEKREFEFYNAGTKDVKIVRLSYDTSFMIVKLNKLDLKSQEIAKLDITYNAVARRDWGFVSDTITFFTTDDSMSVKRIPLAAHIEEYFAPLDATSAAKAPKIKFEKQDHHFGTVKEGAAVSFNYKFTNEGKEALVIRKLVPACKCIFFEIPKYELAPGESSFVRLTLNTKDREGIQNKHLTIITNSPSNPSINLWMRANVVK